jgi:hypothetical protein
LKQDWQVKALNSLEASRFDMEHIAEMFNNHGRLSLAFPATRYDGHASLEAYSCDMHFVWVPARAAEAYIAAHFALQPDATTACQLQRRVRQKVHSSG